VTSAECGCERARVLFRLLAHAPSFATVFAAAFLGAVFAGAAEPTVISGRAMGTNWTVKFIEAAPVLDRDMVARRVAARLEELERQFSTYRANSELSRFNATATTDWIPVSPELAQVASESISISGLTQGAFDPTVHPLVRLWGFGAQRRADGLPTDREISAALARTGWRNLAARQDFPALRKLRADVSVDFSSIAKGFAADEIGRLLAGLGQDNFFVQIAGDVRCGGHSADGGPWRVGIEQPLDMERAIASVIGLSDQALSTSGDYRNFFMSNGRRYSHIIDPRTGRPATSALASVTVVHASCARSSALATALFVLGPEDGFQLALHERLACLFIVRDATGFTQRATPEFARLGKETDLSSRACP
jgi:FAD:protein FMN transferase